MAGGGLQELRRRIKSVQNTKQITRAMKLVAGAKLRRAEERARQARDFFHEIKNVTARAAQKGTRDHELLVRRDVRKVGMVVVSSDRGLAGPFNTNLFRRASNELSAFEKNQISIYAVGRKARDFFRYRGFTIANEFIGIGDDPTYRQAKAVADMVIDQFKAGEVDQVFLTYTEYTNAMTQRAVTTRLLPVADIETNDQEASSSYSFEPDAKTVFEDLLPRYVEVLIYGALLESKASEQGARMVAMDSASKNAEELIRKMILMRNRLRQAAITREIAELVGGAEALK